MLTVDRETFERLCEFLFYTGVNRNVEAANHVLSLLGLQAPEQADWLPDCEVCGVSFKNANDIIRKTHVERCREQNPDGWLQRSLDAVEADPPRGRLHPDDPGYIPAPEQQQTSATVGVDVPARETAVAELPTEKGGDAMQQPRVWFDPAYAVAYGSFDNVHVARGRFVHCYFEGCSFGPGEGLVFQNCTLQDCEPVGTSAGGRVGTGSPVDDGPPRAGDVVRVDEIWDGDQEPQHYVGNVVKVNNWRKPVEAPEPYMLLNHGTYCRVTIIRRAGQPEAKAPEFLEIEHPANAMAAKALEAEGVQVNRHPKEFAAAQPEAKAPGIFTTLKNAGFEVVAEEPEAQTGELAAKTGGLAEQTGELPGGHGPNADRIAELERKVARLENRVMPLDVEVFAERAGNVHEHGWQWRPTDADTAFAPPFGTIRQCRVCGCLVAGGPTACARCAEAGA